MAFLDKNGIIYLWTKITGKLLTKVDKETGKGLSETNYTQVEKTKLTGIATAAQVNAIESVKVNGTAQAIASKAVNITVPTTVSQLTDAGNYALKADIAGMYKYKGSITDVSKLPTSGQVKGDVYNIQSASIYGAAGANVAWDGSMWDTLGEIFQIDIITNLEIDAICQ